MADNPGVIARPPLLYLGALGVAVVMHFIHPLPIAGRTAGLWFGLALVVAGAALARWGRRTLEVAGTNINPALPATTIVTAGPYRFSRNPLYVALTLIFSGLTLAINTWWGFVVLVPLLIVMHTAVVLREERYLENKFGESYRAYKARVRRWL